MSLIKNPIVAGSNSGGGLSWETVYPVGCYFETSDTNFDPNVAWGGTWVKDSDGRTTIAQDTNTFATVGDTGGAESHTLITSELANHSHTYYKSSSATDSHTLTVTELPSHSHTYNKASANTDGHALTLAELPSSSSVAKGLMTYGSGSGQTTGRFSYSAESGSYATGTSSTKTYSSLTLTLGSGNTHNHAITTTSTNTGTKGSGSGHTHDITTTTTSSGASGSGDAFSILNPYVVVVRWHRTA